MSTLISRQVLSPTNHLEECAQFVIGDARERFTLFDVTIAGEKYTFSFWVKSDESGSLLVRGESIPTDAEWTRHVTTFIAEGSNIEIDFGSTGTYYIYHPQIEIGSLATDWTMAVEDMANLSDLEHVRTDLTQAISNLSVTAEGIRASVDTLNNQVALQLSKEDVTIAIKNTLSGGVEKIATETGFTFDNTGLTVENTGSEMKTQITENGMTVYKTEIDNGTSKDVAMLVANSNGVEAKDLHATTFLIIGDKSRFEKYANDTRVGCFWIGG